MVNKEKRKMDREVRTDKTRKREEREKEEEEDVEKEESGVTALALFDHISPDVS